MASRFLYLLVLPLLRWHPVVYSEMPLAAVPTHWACALMHKRPVTGLFFLAARWLEIALGTGPK